MTAPCDCACSEARAKVEAVVISLRVMRAGLEALEVQIDQMLATAETELKQASKRACPENPVLPAPAVERAPQGSTEAGIAIHYMAASQGLVDPAVAETADCPPDVGVECANETPIFFEQKTALLADSGTNSHIPGTADVSDEERAGEDPRSTGAAGEPAPKGLAEAGVQSHNVTLSERLVDLAVAETANCPPDVSAQDTNETPIFFEQKTALLADSGTNSHIPATADVSDEGRAGEDPRSTGGAGVMDCLLTSCNDETETESQLEPLDENIDDHNVEPQSSEGAALPAAGDNVESISRRSNVLALATRRRRMFRKVAASIAGSLVFLGILVATMSTLDGLTSLARATGLR